MTNSELEAALPQVAWSVLKSQGAPDSIAAFMDLAATELVISDVPQFAALIQHPDFQQFLKARLKGSRSRLETLVRLILGRLAAHVRVETVASMAATMASSTYRNVERSFFFVPIDQEACDIFDQNFRDAAMHSKDDMNWFLEFCTAGCFGFLRSGLPKESFEPVIRRMTGLLLAKHSSEIPKAATDFLLEESVTRFLVEAIAENVLEAFLDAVFSLFYGNCDTHQILLLLNIFAQRYPNTAHISLLLEIWPVLMIIDSKELRQDFQMFLKLYGNQKDAFSNFVWSVSFGQVPPRALRAINLFVSPAFQSILKSFSHKQDILRLLITNILNILLETEIKDLNMGVYPIILKMLLKLKVEERFLDRRATLFKWLKNQTQSFRIELEAVRIFLFEYIFLATGIVPTEKPQTITRVIGPEHELLVRVLDTDYLDVRNRKEKSDDSYFLPILQAFRNRIWTEAEAKFSAQSYQLAEIRSAVVALDQEDAALFGLENLDPEFMEFYHEGFMELYKRAPDECVVALQADHWCRVNFSEAIPNIQSTILPIIGLVPVEPDLQNPEPGYACTNGSIINLPQWINHFPDRKDPLLNNRNLSMFTALTLHEAGHIIAGTFAIDVQSILARMDQPKLYHFIHNAFEDYRIERFVKKAHLHPQGTELIDAMNGYLSALLFHGRQGRPADFIDLLLWICDCTDNSNSLMLANPEYMAMIDGLLDADLPSGRFTSVRTMAEYGIERLRHLDVRNIMSVHLLAMEFHDILKHWPENLRRPERERLGNRGPNPNPAPSNEKRQILDQDELRALYDECNRNPKRFLSPLGLHALANFGETKPNTGGAPDGDDKKQSHGGAERMLERDDYTQKGTIDNSTRTALDDLMALAQTSGKRPDTPAGGKIDLGSSKKKKKSSGKNSKKGNTRRIYSIDPKTKSRTLLTEVELFPISLVDHQFLNRFRRWEYISERVFSLLAEILPRTSENEEHSATEGDVDMERLIEIISDRSNIGPQEFMQIWSEDFKKDIEVVIGIDISGSTSMTLPDGITVLDVEKSFAMIFGSALSAMTERIRFLAFNSMFTTNVYEATSINAISSFVADNGNRDGDFIRYVTNELKDSTASQCYFFLLSDGQPAGGNYTGMDGLDDTLMAMRECVHEGIKLVYLNVDYQESDYFHAFQQECTYARHFSAPADLMPAIPELVRKIVESVAAS